MPKNNPTPAAERFAKYVGRPNTKGCTLWKGAVSGENDYGYFQAGSNRKTSRVVRAHRFAWEMAHGAIPEGLDVLHKCDTPLCVNVAHLFLGTQRDNYRDMREKRRDSPPPLLAGTVHPKSKLDDEKVREIRRRHASGGETLRGLAAAFGVSDKLILNVVRRRTWKHVA
jgi:hypothetical protein